MNKEPMFSEFSREFTQTFANFCESPAPEADFVSRLERQLIQKQSNSLQKSDSQPSQVEKRWQRIAMLLSQRKWQTGLILGLLMLALLSLFIFRRPQPVDAQSILARAQLVAGDLQANGINSFEMVSETANYLNKFDGSISETPAIKSQMHTWYQLPNHWRYELRFLDDTNQEFDLSPQVTVADGKLIWSFDPNQNTLQINDGLFGTGGKDGEAGLYGTNGDLQTILLSFSQCFSPSLQADNGEGIAGRKTYQIFLGVSKCPSGAAAAFNGAQTLWIDQKTFFILKWETRDSNNKQLVQSMDVIEIEYNPNLSPSLFTFIPPQGAHVLDNRSNSSQNGSVSTQTPTFIVTPGPDMSSTAAVTQTPQLPFSVLKPSWLPEEMRESMQVDGQIVTLRYDPNPDGPPHALIALIEIPAALVDAGGAQDPQTSQEQIGDREVTVVRRGQECTNFTWYEKDLQLSFNNVYDPPGHLRYSCDQMRKVIESIP